VDDGCPSRAGTTDGLVYTTYLFGPGSFGMGFADLNGAPVEGGHGTEGCEMARDALNSDTFLVNRRRFILHPRGVKFTSASVAGAKPDERGIGNGRKLGARLGKQKRPGRGGHSQHLTKGVPVRAGTPILPINFMGKILPRSLSGFVRRANKSSRQLYQRRGGECCGCDGGKVSAPNHLSVSWRHGFSAVPGGFRWHELETVAIGANAI